MPASPNMICYLSEYPLRTLPLDGSTPGSLASSLVFKHIGPIAALSYLPFVLHSARTAFPQYKMKRTSPLIYENNCSDYFFKITVSLFFVLLLLKDVPIGYSGGLIMKNCYIQKFN